MALVAGAPYKGSIRRSVPFTVDISPEASNSDPTAVTLASIVRSGRIRDPDVLIIPGGGPAGVRTVTLGANVVLFEVFIYQAANDLAEFRLTQGTNVITHDVIGDTTVVLDVVP